MSKNKEKQKKNDQYLNILIAVPLHMKVYDDGNFKELCHFISLSLFGVDNEQYVNLRKGTFVEIIGQIVGNSDAEGTLKKDLIVIPKSIMRGASK